MTIETPPISERQADRGWCPVRRWNSRTSAPPDGPDWRPGERTGVRPSRPALLRFGCHHDAPSVKPATKRQEEISDTAVADRCRDRQNRSSVRGRNMAQDQQDGEGADIENALHRPDRHLGGKRQFLPARNQIGANQFSRASQQSQAGEPDQRRRNNPGERSLLAHGRRKIFQRNARRTIAHVDQATACKIWQRCWSCVRSPPRRWPNRSFSRSGIAYKPAPRE